MDIFKLEPLVEGYDFNVGNNVREQKLEGGMPRQVVKRVGAIHTVGVTVLLPDEAARQYFWSFWRKNSQRIGQPSTAAPKFNWTLMIDNYTLETCNCQFVSSEQPKESFLGGYASKVKFSVYVSPIQRSAESDAIIVDLYGTDLMDKSELFELIANVWLPDATGV